LSGASPASKSIVTVFTPVRSAVEGSTMWPFTTRGSMRAPPAVTPLTTPARPGAKSSASGADRLRSVNVMVATPVMRSPRSAGMLNDRS
jgi:hypothetical protein